MYLRRGKYEGVAELVAFRYVKVPHSVGSQCSNRKKTSMGNKSLTNYRMGTGRGNKLSIKHEGQVAKTLYRGGRSSGSCEDSAT